MYIAISNRYALLPAYSAYPLPKSSTRQTNATITKKTKPSKFCRKAERGYQARLLTRARKICEATIIDDHIDMAEDERTDMAKANQTDAKRISADHGHSTTRSAIGASFIQRTKKAGQVLWATAKRAIQQFWNNKPHVRFVPQAQIRQFHSEQQALMVTYDSGADGHYISERDRAQAK